MCSANRIELSALWLSLAKARPDTIHVRCDSERIERIQQSLRKAGLNALVCALPANVLMLSGYWPAVGSSLAVAARDGQVSLIVPEYEEALAQTGWADKVHTFRGGSLRELKSVCETVSVRLAKVLTDMELTHGSVLGFESRPMVAPASY